MSLLPSISRPNAALYGPHSNDRQVIGFELHQPSAKSVWLLGIVGDWHPSFVQFQDHGHGVWTAKIELGPGNYSYRLIVDGSSSDASAVVGTDSFSRSIATRFFSIPRIAVAEHNDREDAVPAALPANNFRASTKFVQQRGFIHHANRRT